MDRSRLISGNKAGGSAIDFKLARQQAQQANQDRVGSEIGLSESIRGGKLSGLAGLSGVNRDEGEFGLARAAGQAGNERFITGSRQSGKQFGISGLAGLDENSNRMELQALSQKFGIDQGYLQALLQGKGKGLNWGRIASGAAGAIAAPFTGGASLGMIR